MTADRDPRPVALNGLRLSAAAMRRVARLSAELGVPEGDLVDAVLCYVWESEVAELLADRAGGLPPLP